jgi:uncharacterized protein with ParB-like and HNH nuclease domain
MIKSAEHYPISTIFGIEEKVKYVVPKYQREYIWGKENWEYLLNDLLDSDGGHFLGSILCVDKGKDVLDIRPLEIIDGQQRLTTISLLYSAIYNRLLKEDRKDEDFITEKNNLKHRLIQKNARGIKLGLSYQNKNFEDYNSVVCNELKLYDEVDKPLHAGNRQIYRTYRYFEDKISDFDYNRLLDLLKKVNEASVVKIEVENYADAFDLFESLNNRGEPLSPIDLIKNKALSEFEKKEIKSIDDAFNEWRKLIENLPDYSAQERFLRQYYNAFRYKEKIKIKGFSKATRSTLIKIYEKLINQDVGFIFNELVEKSKTYKLFLEPKKDGENRRHYNGLMDLLHIGAAPSYTFLLYLFEEHKDDAKLIEDSIHFMVKYFVRRNLTDFPGTRDLDKIFTDLIDECEKNKNSLTSSFIIEYLIDTERFSNIEKIREKLEGDLYEDNAIVARFILCNMEEKHQTRETYRDLWERDRSNKFIWTIEHIFPEGKNIPKEWVDMIADGNEEKAKELQIEHVHKLGNLTLTGYNSKLSNFSFEKKRDRKDSKGDYIGYRNRLYLNKKLKDKCSWTIEDIQNRTDELVKEVLGMFSIDDEKI